MLETLQILQIVVGGLMIVAIGVLLYLNYRWSSQSSLPPGKMEPDKKARMQRYITLLIVVLVVPNVILILLTRGLS